MNKGILEKLKENYILHLKSGLQFGTEKQDYQSETEGTVFFAKPKIQVGTNSDEGSFSRSRKHREEYAFRAFRNFACLKLNESVVLHADLSTIAQATLRNFPISKWDFQVWKREDASCARVKSPSCHVGFGKVCVLE